MWDLEFAMSCPVCFNAATSDDTVRTSLNLGIFVLLGITACVLAGFLRFIISIARRSSSQADLKVRLYDGTGESTGARRADVEAGLQPRLETGTT
jgi:hypothetical protein